MIRGNCLCGSIKFEINNQPKQINLCHCQMCQKFSGSAFGAFMRVQSNDFKLISGHNELRTYDSSKRAARSFCSQCGSSIEYINKEQPELRFIAAGTLESHPGINAHHHIFTKDKASWYHIDRELPQFPDWQSSMANNVI